MIRTALLLLLFVLSLQLRAQYLGAGEGNITVTSSGEFQDVAWPEVAAAENTVNGQGLLHEYFQAHRFLLQASVGFEETDVADVLAMGYEGWIDDQMAVPMEKITPTMDAIFQLVKDNTPSGEELPRRASWLEFNYAWWQINTQNEDLLRHKVATALSEIFVISRNSDVGEYGDGMADYYDLLLEYAFGDYRDLLYDITRHAMMGHYLSHANNPKTIESIGQHPDENYAREIMQLFSIGLYELNLDGTRKQQGGNDIPTYNNDDIAEFAKVFTGLGYYDVIPELTDPNNMYDDVAYFGMGLWNANVVEPMKMYDVDDPNTMYNDEDQHEDGDKTLLNGYVIEDGQTGLEDIGEAVSHLAGHPNVAPFLGLRLIQRLVKSNPSPAYIQRVSNAFNGAGGNLGAMVKAILMDEEARDLSYQEDATNSKLKEPMFRFTQFARMVEKFHPDNRYWNVNYNLYQSTRQDLMASPSVFNFFLYDDTPNGAISDAGLVAPEFKLHDARTSVGYFNTMSNATAPWGQLMYVWEDWIEEDVDWVIDDLLALADDTEVWLNWLDQHILGGQMSDHLRTVLREAMNVFSPNVTWHEHRENRVRIGMHLALMSADYAVMR